jgi:hypothetical protein
MIVASYRYVLGDQLQLCYKMYNKTDGDKTSQAYPYFSSYITGYLNTNDQGMWI